MNFPVSAQGFGMVIGSYVWFLWHNREVSYRTVLTETTSRRQQKLYGERGFDMDRYNELIEEAKGFRRAVKRVAWDYGLEWDQGETEAGKGFGHGKERQAGAEQSNGGAGRASHKGRAPGR